MDMDEALDRLDIFIDDDGSLVQRIVEWVELGCDCCTDTNVTFAPVSIESLRNELKEEVDAGVYATALRTVISELERLQVGKSDDVHGSVLEGAL